MMISCDDKVPTRKAEQMWLNIGEPHPIQQYSASG